MKRLTTLLILGLSVPVAITAAACDEGDDGCALQCAILSDCGAVASADRDECIDTCRVMLSGDCEEGCLSGGGGDPAECARELLEANPEADGDECSTDFVNEWCDTYYNDPACAPLSIGGITCT